MRRTYKTILVVLSISLLLVSCAPKEKAERLARSVEIRRDTFGIPHIKAKDEEALYFGMGFAQAEDKLELLAKNYILSQGRGAEVFGKDYLSSDMLIARFRINEIAEREFDQASSQMKQIYEAFTQGLNYYIDSHRDSLPEWIPHFSPIDPFRNTVFGIFYFIYFSQSHEIERYLAPSGSNMWAIAPRRTEYGHTLFLANPHLPWDNGFVWYEAHFTIPGKLNASGATLIGMPALSVGHNEFMAWSPTVNNPDLLDIYELKLNEDKSAYYYDGTWIPLEKREAIIKVKEETGVREVKRELFYSQHGPIMKIDGDKAYAVKVAGIGEANRLEGWFHIPKVRSFTEFKQVLEEHTLPFFNIAYGDREGNIYYASLAAIPVRTKGHDWKGIVDGSTSETQWLGFHSLKGMAQVSNPSSGYVQNSNGNPGYTTLSETFNIEDFPFMYRDRQSIGLRTQLGLIMLEDEEKFTLEKLLACKWNTRLLSAERYKDELLKICRQHPVKGEDRKILDEAIKVLEEWDNTTSIDNRGAQLFLLWALDYMYRAENPWIEPWNADQPISTPQGIANKKAAVELLIDAAKKMQEQYGTLAPLWSDIRYIQRGDKTLPLAGEGGHFGSFRVTFWTPLEQGKYRATGGDSFVMAVEFSDPLKAFTITPYGASNDPSSSHFSDQTELFARDQMKPAWFSEKEVKANLEKKYKPAEVKPGRKTE